MIDLENIALLSIRSKIKLYNLNINCEELTINCAFVEK